MRVIRDFLYFLNSLVVMVGSLWVLFNIDVVRPILNLDNSAIWFTIAVWVVFVCGLLAIFLYIVKGAAVKSIVRTNDMGQLKINLKAIEDIAQAEIKRLSGIKVIKTPVNLAEKGVSVEIKVGVSVDENVPDLALLIQRRVKEAIEKTTEVPVVDVKVVISDIFSPVKSRVE